MENKKIESKETESKEVKKDRRKKEDPKVKVAKIRINKAEFAEFDKASKELNMEKTIIMREAIKEYLAKRDIEIWN